jgi:hypothetical protein
MVLIMTITTNRPAFPSFFPEARHNGKTLRPRDEHTGMSVREYFAAHAPHGIPDWFKPEMADAPNPPTLRPCSDQAVRLAENWRSDPCYDLDDAARERTDLSRMDLQSLRAYEHAMRVYRAARQLWEEERERQKVAQWPWAWADLVLVSR